MQETVFKPNIGNSIFAGYNDSEGLMLCGYEWGFSKTDQANPNRTQNHVAHVFSNKAAEYGDTADRWRYDQRIIKWFDLFGHQLKVSGGDEVLEKSIVQTNWCDTHAHKISGSYRKKLLAEDQINNFIAHIRYFRPKLIFFFGSQLIRLLQYPEVYKEFSLIVGQETEPLRPVRKEEFDGRKFTVTFQSFQNCRVVCFPHPSSSRGLKDDYIKLFSSEISGVISEFLTYKRLQLGGV